MILWFSVAGPQAAESGLSCGDSYRVWVSSGAVFLLHVGFPIGMGFSYGFFLWIEVFLWGFPHGSEFFLSWGFPARWSFPKEVLYVMLDSVDSNNRVVNCI